jgi:hypothetical protein
MSSNRSLLLPAVVFLSVLAPAAAQANYGDFSGGVAIGSSYAVTDTAPTDGLIVQGNVGIGTTSPQFPLDATVTGAGISPWAGAFGF